MLKVGSLCTGIAGAEMALELMGLDVDLRWYAEVDKDASAVLAQRLPGVPNLGDLTTVEWERIERVDVLTAGYPCQPFSLAGKRQGEDDDRHLWPHILCTLRILRPALLLAENVSSHLSLGFDRVLGDLASVGFDASWTTLRASDVGACHQRDRLFIAATSQHPDGGGCRESGIIGMGRAVGERRADSDAPAEAPDASQGAAPDARRSGREGQRCPEATGGGVLA